MEDEGWRMEDRGWRMEDGGRSIEDGGWRMGDRGWRTFFLGTIPSHGHDPEGGWNQPKYFMQRANNSVEQREWGCGTPLNNFKICSSHITHYIEKV